MSEIMIIVNKGKEKGERSEEASFRFGKSFSINGSLSSIKLDKTLKGKKIFRFFSIDLARILILFLDILDEILESRRNPVLLIWKYRR